MIDPALFRLAEPAAEEPLSGWTLVATCVMIDGKPWIVVTRLDRSGTSREILKCEQSRFGGQ